jgi:polysaccharide biosynthesis transport protein
MELNQYPDDFNLQKYWMVLKRRWLPAAAVFSLVVSLSALAAVRQKPV